MLLELLHYTFLTVLLAYPVKSQSYGELRLVQKEGRGDTGDDSPSAGLLEVFLNEEWGNICEHGFDMIDANVACRQMGYAAATSFTPAFFSTFGIGENSSVWLSHIDCKDPNGLHLLSCAHRKVGVYECDHFSDIAVVCEDTPLSQLEEGQVRLTVGEHKSEGVLEIACDGEWRTVHGSDGVGFSQREADAVCWQLGFTEASSFDVEKLLDSPDDGSLPESGLLIQNRTWYSLPPCIGEYQHCSFKCSNSEFRITYSENSSNASYGIYIQCNHTLTYGALRLALIEHSLADTESGDGQGRLEMFSEGQWGTVCGAMFGLIEADLACRQLGYYRVLRYRHSLDSHLGHVANRSIVVKGIECTPEDDDLAYCSRPELPEDITCTHKDDIILFCTDNPYPITTGVEQSRDNSWPLPFSKQTLIEISAGAGFGIILICCCLIAWCTFCCCHHSNSRKKKRLKKLGLVPIQNTLKLSDDSEQKSSKSSEEDSETKEPDVIVLAATIQEKLKPSLIPCTSPSFPKTFEISIDSIPEDESQAELQREEESVMQVDSEKEREGGKDKGKKRGRTSMEPIPEEEREMEGEDSEVTTEQTPIGDGQVVESTAEPKNEISLDWTSVLQTLDENIESAMEVQATEIV